MVTGANKGIGLEIVKQLSSEGVTVILTARDDKRGNDAVASLCDHLSINSDRVIFHQLDVLDPLSVQNLAKFIEDKFGRLDILVICNFFKEIFIYESKFVWTTFFIFVDYKWFENRVLGYLEFFLSFLFSVNEICVNCYEGLDIYFFIEELF